MECRWDPEKCTNDSFLVKRQRGEGPRISLSMDTDRCLIHIQDAAHSDCSVLQCVAISQSIVV